MVSVLDSVRTRFGLDSLFVTFRSRGLDDRLAKAYPLSRLEIAPVDLSITP